MPNSNSCDTVVLGLAADLDAATAPAAHARLLAGLDTVESSGARAVLDLDTAGGDVSTLAIQLLVSAQRSFPPERLDLGPRAVAALATPPYARKS